MQKKFKYKPIITFHWWNIYINNIYNIAIKHVDWWNFAFDCTPTYDVNYVNVNLTMDAMDRVRKQKDTSYMSQLYNLKDNFMI